MKAIGSLNLRRSLRTRTPFFSCLLAVFLLLPCLSLQSQSIFVDFNGLTKYEAFHAGMFRGKVDGLLFLSYWSQDVYALNLWPTIFRILDVEDRIISEDVLNYPLPGPSYDYNSLRRLGINPLGSLIYNEWPAWDTCVPINEINLLDPERLRDGVIVINREFLDGPDHPRASHLLRTMAHPAVTGVCFEVTPGFDQKGRNPMQDNNIVNGIKMVLGCHKLCLLLMPPSTNFPGRLSYSRAVESSFKYLSANGVPLESDNLVVIFAGYKREETLVT